MARFGNVVVAVFIFCWIEDFRDGFLPLGQDEVDEGWAVQWLLECDNLAAAAVASLLGLGASSAGGEANATCPGATARALGGHTRLDVGGHAKEGVLDVGGVLGGGLDEGDVVLVSKGLGHLGVDDLLEGQIALVTDEELVDAITGVFVNLTEPLLNVVEGLHIGDIVHYGNTVGTAVVGGGDGAEALLSSGIPDLKLDGLPVQVQGADLEIDTDGADVGLGVGIIDETEEEARLSDAGVSDQEDLEKVVVLRAHCRC